MTVVPMTERRARRVLAVGAEWLDVKDQLFPEHAITRAQALVEEAHRGLRSGLDLSEITRAAYRAVVLANVADDEFETEDDVCWARLTARPLHENYFHDNHDDGPGGSGVLEGSTT